MGVASPLPRLTILAASTALAVPLSLAACGLFFPTTLGEADTNDGGDAGTESSTDAGAGTDTSPGDAPTSQDGAVAAQDFAITVSPQTVSLAPGQSVELTVTVQRFGSFTGVVALSLSLPPYMNPPAWSSNAPGTSDSVALQSEVSAAPAVAQAGALGDFQETVYGTWNNESASAPVTIHLSGLLAVLSVTTDIVVPAQVSTVTIKAWGAGGGGGQGGNTGSQQGAQPGGPGGGGGFVELDGVPVVPGETLHVDVGTAGAGRGGGGGYSAVSRAGAPIVQAAAGGGGGQGGAYTGGGGGAGGGASGQGASGGGGGGTQLDGGAGGANYLAGPSPGGSKGQGGGFGTGGVPGGGGGGNGGGGGAGYYGGGAGGCPGAGGGYVTCYGGGGGSSWPVTGATSVAGNLTAPASTTDPDYTPGVGQGGDAGAVNKPSAGSGGAGRVVLIVR